MQMLKILRFRSFGYPRELNPYSSVLNETSRISLIGNSGCFVYTIHGKESGFPFLFLCSGKKDVIQNESVSG